MKSFAQVAAEDRRLQILRLLAQAPDYTGNLPLLQTALTGMGHAVGADRLHTELAWLEEQGLTTCTQLADITLAKLTQRGLDVSEGRAEVPGVKRPGPGA
jgi:hypothetical protein